MNTLLEHTAHIEAIQGIFNLLSGILIFGVAIPAINSRFRRCSLAILLMLFLTVSGLYRLANFLVLVYTAGEIDLDDTFLGLVLTLSLFGLLLGLGLAYYGEKLKGRRR